MSQLVRCEQCRLEHQQDTAVNWLKVDLFGLDARALGHPLHSLPWHFCSVQCAAAFFHACVPLSVA